MYESLLLNVSKYAASDKTSPIENFITEAFAWLLRNDMNAQAAILELVKTKSKKQDLAFYKASDEFDISTQMNFNGNFPDMVWQDHTNDWALVFEHKVWSELHDQQLHNYRQHAEQHYPNYALVLITARLMQHRQNPDVALCWYDVADCLRKLPVESDKLQWLRNEFISLLDGNGLLNITPIDPLSLNYYKAAKKIDEQLHNICLQSINETWPLEGYLDFKKQNSVRKKEGRVGFYISQPVENDKFTWRPGVFSGFLLDGWDHMVDDLLDNGPIASLILSFGKAHHSISKTSPIYKQLINELQSSTELRSLWTVHDRSQRVEFNHWHPLVISANLVELFESCNSIDTQIQRYNEEMKKLQQVLISCTAFTQLCELLKPKT
ncbi:hypothetical protein [Marinomonas sp.]|uniref:hypothetical protein n=1 Tax=Marinomonas sp. TaxID=1904862 RepID=UPI003BAD4D14